MKYDGVNMDKRRYVQRARAAATEATRGRILDAAEASFDRGPLAAVKIDDVARRAGVSRSTVYQLFGSRRGLLVALAGRFREVAEFERLLEASMLPVARESLRRAQRESVPDVRDATRTSPGPCSRWRASTPTPSRRSPRSRTAGARACSPSRAGSRSRASSGRGSQREEAADLLSVATSFPAFDELYHARRPPGRRRR